jgi:hypothetical protein
MVIRDRICEKYGGCGGYELKTTICAESTIMIADV